MLAKRFFSLEQSNGFVLSPALRTDCADTRADGVAKMRSNAQTINGNRK